METQFSRTERLLGEAAMKRLQEARVAVFGIGGVGGYVCEALARSGIGTFELVDNDRVSLTNLNRQIIATHKTIGRYKTEVMKERILEINPDAEVQIRQCFFLPENADQFSFSEYDYVVDAVDTVTAKIEIILRAKEAGVPVISSMGTGNKLDPSRLRVMDLTETRVCPLARVMRRELKKRNVEHLKVVCSDEPPMKAADAEEELELKPEGSAEEDPAVSSGTLKPAHQSRRAVPASTAFVPAAAGLMIAGAVIQDLSGIIR